MRQKIKCWQIWFFSKQIRMKRIAKWAFVGSFSISHPTLVNIVSDSVFFIAGFFGLVFLRFCYNVRLYVFLVQEILQYVIYDYLARYYIHFTLTIFNLNFVKVFSSYTLAAVCIHHRECTSIDLKGKKFLSKKSRSR